MFGLPARCSDDIAAMTVVGQEVSQHTARSLCGLTQRLNVCVCVCVCAVSRIGRAIHSQHIRNFCDRVDLTTAASVIFACFAPFARSLT